jgi:hypothetical protein
MANREQKIQKRDDCLLKNEKSWRRARIGAIFLFLVFSIMLYYICTDDFLSKDERPEGLAAIVFWFMLWLVIIDTLNLRIRYIDSIKFYRERICTEVNSK